MKVSDAYKVFLSKMNESATSRGMAVNKGKFCVIFNRNMLSVVQGYLEEKDSDKIEEIKELHKDSYELQISKNSSRYSIFSLPENYLEYSTFHVNATSDKGCSSNITIFPVKPREIEIILGDEFNKPSFFYREAPFIIVSEGVKIYKEKFNIDQVLLSYYRAPKYISLVNSSDPESAFIDAKIELRDSVVNEILDRTVLEYSLSHADYNKFQAEANNIALKNNKQ